MREILCDIARHLIVHMYSFRTSFDILPLFARALRARKLSGAAVPYPSRHVLPMVFWKGRRDSRNLFRACFVPGRWIRFWTAKARVQFSCLQSHPRLPMTCRRDAGIFSINNARDLKLPKHRRSGTRWAIRINRPFDRCLVRLIRKKLSSVCPQISVD